MLVDAKKGSLSASYRAATEDVVNMMHKNFKECAEVKADVLVDVSQLLPKVLEYLSGVKERLAKIPK